MPVITEETELVKACALSQTAWILILALPLLTRDLGKVSYGEK